MRPFQIVEILEGLVFPTLSLEKKREIISVATRAITDAISDPPTSFRSPFLSFDLKTITILTELGYSIILLNGRR